MRLLNLFFALLCCGLCITSCTKTKTNTVTKTVVDSVYVTPTTYPDYMVLKPGNYWVYEIFRVFSADSAVSMGHTDSFYVEKDTTIGSNTYHKLVKFTVYLQPGPQIYFLRDSLSYVVTSGGGIMFSSQDFSTVFTTRPYTNPPAGVPDTIQLTTQMGFKDVLTTVPIGVFQTSTFRQLYHFAPALTMEEYDWKYAQHIGLISQTVGFYTFPNVPWYEDRLLRYHVE